MTNSKATHVLLWILQILLAALFIFSGIMKLVMPAEQLTAQSPFSAGFIRFIGAMEILGGLGLILPGLTRIKTGLTPLAAAGLTIIMIGATVSTIPLGPIVALPLVVCLLVAFVAWGRWRIAPLRNRGAA